MTQVYLLIVTLAALRVWGAIDIPGFLILAFYLLSSIKNIKRKSVFKPFILLLILFLVVSAFTSKYFRGQDIYATLRQTSPYMMICGYFYYMDKKFSVCNLEYLIYVLTIIFDFAYILQYLLYPYGIAIFPDAETEYGTDVRLRLYGQNICSLGMMFTFNKWLLTSKKKYFYVALTSFFIIFLWGFRTLFAASTLFLLLMYCKIKGVKSLMAFTPIFIVLLILVFQVPVVQEKIMSMLERQNTNQSFGDKDYIRNLSINYYLFEHFKSGWEMFWGSGIPSGESDYTNLMDYLDRKGFHWNDMGLWGLSWVLGVPSVILMIGYGVKASMMRMEWRYIYLPYWFLFSLLTGFTTAEYIRIGNYIPQAIALALIYKLSFKQTKKISV